MDTHYRLHLFTGPGSPLLDGSVPSLSIYVYPRCSVHPLTDYKHVTQPQPQQQHSAEQRRQREDANRVTNEGLHYDYDKAEDKSFRVVDSGTGKRKGACVRACVRVRHVSFSVSLSHPHPHPPTHHT